MNRRPFEARATLCGHATVAQDMCFAWPLLNSLGLTESATAASHVHGLVVILVQCGQQ